MSDTAIPPFRGKRSPWQVFQGVVSYAVALAALLAACVVVIAVARAILSSGAALQAQSERSETLSIALSERQAMLRENLLAIGADPRHDLQRLASARTLDQLNADTQLVTRSMQAFGFRVESQASPTEHPISANLSRYEAVVAFSGEAEAIAAFLDTGVTGDFKMSALSIDKASPSLDDMTYALSVTLTRLGASSSMEADFTEPENGANE